MEIKMPQVLLKNGELKEITDEEMFFFLEQKRHLIQDRYSTRTRKIKRSEPLTQTTNTK